MGRTDSERFGGYRVLRQISSIGPVRVCEAHDESLNRRVTLCWLPEDTHAETRESFLSVARTVSAADNPHLPTVFEIVDNSAVSYWVLEMFHDGSLAEWLSGFPPTVEQSVRIGRQLADALVLTESLGLSPVALQPETVWLERPRDTVVSHESAGFLVRLRDFQTIGPEAADSVQQRVLSEFGLILYRMLSGTEPDPATAATEALPALNKLAPHVPATLVRLVNELLEAGSGQNDGSPSPTIASVASRLKSIERQTSARRVSPTRFAGVTAVLALVAGLWWFNRRDSSDPQRQQVSPASPVPAAIASNDPPQAALSGADSHDSAIKGDSARGTSVAQATAAPTDVPATQTVVVPTRPKFEPLAPGWREIVQTLEPQQQMDAVKLELRRRNPAWDGTIRDVHIEDGKVLGFGMHTDDVTDISPISALSELTWLVCPGTTSRSGKLADLSPLAGLKLVTLRVGWTQVADLSPLSGMPLKELNLGATQVVDLSPLAGMPLENLSIWGNTIRDLSPLAELKELRQLRIGHLPARDITPLTGLPLERLDCEKVFPRDWSPLATLPLVTLKIDYDAALHGELLRSIETLKEINGQPADEVLP